VVIASTVEPVVVGTLLYRVNSNKVDVIIIEVEVVETTDEEVVLRVGL
jgi:hypothetical protein